MAAAAAAPRRLRRSGVILPEDPSDEELARNWTLSESDKRQVLRCRGEENRRRFALQWCVLRRYGRFLEAEETAPVRIINHLGAQLDLSPALFVGASGARQHRPSTANESDATSAMSGFIATCNENLLRGWPSALSKDYPSKK